VITLGARSTKQSLIDQTVRLKTEGPLREDELLFAENRLYRLGIFDWALIDPRRQITTQTEEDVVVKVHESKLNEIRYGFGFEVINAAAVSQRHGGGSRDFRPRACHPGFGLVRKTFWGPRGTFQYTRRNFEGRVRASISAFLERVLSNEWEFSYRSIFCGRLLELELDPFC